MREVEVRFRDGQKMNFALVTECRITNAPERVVKITEETNKRQYTTIIPLDAVAFVRDKQINEEEGQNDGSV